jgi:ribosomal protein S24E
MKLSKVILENNKVITRKELNMSEEDINKLTETITNKLVDYLDIDKQEVLTQVVKEAITEIIKK